MFCSNLTYPISHRPEDVYWNMRHNQMEYLYGDIMVRGYYPGYALRYYDEHNIHINFYPGDEEALKEGTVDFVSLSYYYSRLSGEEPRTCTPSWVRCRTPIFRPATGAGALTPSACALR